MPAPTPKLTYDGRVLIPNLPKWWFGGPDETAYQLPNGDNACPVVGWYIGCQCVEDQGSPAPHQMATHLGGLWTPCMLPEKPIDHHMVLCRDESCPACGIFIADGWGHYSSERMAGIPLWS